MLLGRNALKGGRHMPVHELPHALCRDLVCDVICESTGLFTTQDGAEKVVH
jgi:hypothetical protein